MWHTKNNFLKFESLKQKWRENFTIYKHIVNSDYI